MAIETLQASDEFDNERFDYTEIEKQFHTVSPELFESLKDTSDIEIIEQLYISHPDEPYSLRLRQSSSASGVEYTATIKDRGTVVTGGLKRMEVSTPIDEGTYFHYRAQSQYPVIRKLRASPAEGVIVDWTEGDDRPIIEIENIETNSEAHEFYRTHSHHLVDKTGDSSVSSEAQAYALHPYETSSLPGEIDAQLVADEIVALYQNTAPAQYVVGISGRSGSGKTTLSREIIAILREYGISVETVSTDDYHRGKKWLETTIRAPWTDWDAPEVYDTNALAFDIWQLGQGICVERRRFDFGREEPVSEGIVQPKNILIVEGIYAGSSDLKAQRHAHIAIPTPLATSVGRRLSRDYKEARLNESLGGMEAILRYQLECAEPAYQKQLA